MGVWVAEGMVWGDMDVWAADGGMAWGFWNPIFNTGPDIKILEC